jgi:hypothetical protein
MAQQRNPSTEVGREFNFETAIDQPNTHQAMR